MLLVKKSLYLYLLKLISFFLRKVFYFISYVLFCVDCGQRSLREISKKDLQSVIMLRTKELSV